MCVSSRLEGCHRLLRSLEQTSLGLCWHVSSRKTLQNSNSQRISDTITNSVCLAWSFFEFFCNGVDPIYIVITGPRGGYIDGRKWKLAKGK